MAAPDPAAADAAALMLHPTLAQAEEDAPLSKEERIRRHRAKLQEAKAAKARPVGDAGQGMSWAPSATALSAGAEALKKGAGPADLRGDAPAPRRGPYVGLANQGATCYMNSLLQTLFMTPEFRSAMYAYVYDAAKDGPAEECVPFHLQRLFALLQLSEDAAVPTRELTRSFGWAEDDAFEQHDAQELLRVLLDALEDAFTDTDQRNVVNDLYEGKLVDYCRCEACGNESARQDAFLDLSLTLRPFGAKTFLDGLEASIDQYLEPEHLDGENKVFCDECHAKHAARKGFRLSQLPLLLTVQLKRFDYDLETFRRVKLNNRFTFPEILDLNTYVHDGPGPEQDSARLGSGAGARILSVPPCNPPAPPNPPRADAGTPPDLLSSPMAMSPLLESGNPSCDPGPLLPPDPALPVPPPTTSSPTPDTAGDLPLPDLVDFFGNKAPEQMREEAAAALGRGPWVYELYSVLVHSGGTYGGHYYAYIKSLDNGSWHRFDDSSVTPLPGGFQRVQAAWGGPTSSASAYMLMYRKITAAPVPLPGPDAVPAPLCEFLAARAAAAERARAHAEAERRRLALPLHAVRRGEVSFLANIHPRPEDTLQDTTLIAIATLQEAQRSGEAAVPVECARLRRYCRGLRVPREVLEGRNGHASLAEMGIKTGDPLYLEVKPPGTAWRPYEPNALSIQMFRYEADRDDFAEPQPVQVPRGASVGDLKQRVREAFALSGDVRIERYLSISLTAASRVQFDDNAASLGELRVADGQSIYVDAGPSDAGGVDGDRMFNAHVRNLNRIYVNFSRPSWAPAPPAVKTGFAIRTVVADKRWTVRKLRDAIAADLGLGTTPFRLRMSPDKGSELKPATLVLGARLMHKTNNVHLEQGEDLPPGHFAFNVYYFPIPRRLAAVTAGQDPGMPRQGDVRWSELSPEAARRGPEPIVDLRRHEDSFELLGSYVVTAATTVREIREKAWADLLRHCAAPPAVATIASSLPSSVPASEAPLVPAPSKPVALPLLDDDAGMGAMPMAEGAPGQDTAGEDATDHGPTRRAAGASTGHREDSLTLQTCTEEHVRVRQKLKHRCGGILRPGPVDAPWTLSDNMASMHDRAELALQLLPAPEDLHLRQSAARETVLDVRWFDRATWIVHPAVEVAVTKAFSATDCALAIAAALKKTDCGAHLLPQWDRVEADSTEAGKMVVATEAPGDASEADGGEVVGMAVATEAPLALDGPEEASMDASVDGRGFVGPLLPVAEVVACERPRLSVFRPVGGRLFVRNLPDENWLALEGDQSLDERRYYLCDGDLVLVQDASQPLGPLPPEFFQDAPLATVTEVSPVVPVRRAERGLRIRHRGRRSPGINGSLSPSPSQTPSPDPSGERVASASAAAASAELVKPAD